MKKIQLIALIILGLVFGVQAQKHVKDADNTIILSEIESGNLSAKLSKDGKMEVFSITVMDEDHSCVTDFCGFSYNSKDKTYIENIKSLNNNLKAVLVTISGDVENCAVLKWESEGIKFTVYGIAPKIAYICVDGHGHGILSKKDMEVLSAWIDELEIK